MFSPSRLVQVSIVMGAAFFFMGLGQEALQLKVSGTRYPALMPQRSMDEANGYKPSYLRLGLNEMLTSLQIFTHLPEQHYPTELLLNKINSCPSLEQTDESKSGLAYNWKLSYGSTRLAPKTILHALEAMGKCGSEDVHLVVGY